MDTLFAALPPAGQTAMLCVTSLVIVAKAFCAVTPTPAPNTPWGRIYRAIEIAALLVGKAKEAGVPVPTLNGPSPVAGNTASPGASNTASQ